MQVRTAVEKGSLRYKWHLTIGVWANLTWETRVLVRREQSSEPKHRKPPQMSLGASLGPHVLPRLPSFMCLVPEAASVSTAPEWWVHPLILLSVSLSPSPSKSLSPSNSLASSWSLVPFQLFPSWSSISALVHFSPPLPSEYNASLSQSPSAIPSPWPWLSPLTYVGSLTHLTFCSPRSLTHLLPLSPSPF